MSEEQQDNDKLVEYGCIGVIILLACGVLWWLWKYVLPLFAVCILCYSAFMIWRTSIEKKRKIWIFVGVCGGVGMLCGCVYAWPWILPIAVCMSFFIFKKIEKLEAIMRKREEAARREHERQVAEETARREYERQVAEESRRAAEEKRLMELAQKKWIEWRRRKYSEVESWFSSANVILDTNVWMSMRNSIIEPGLWDIKEIDECSCKYDWYRFVTHNPGYSLLSILPLLNAKVVVPGAQLDELTNICHNPKNPPKSPKWAAARAAIDRISLMQKKKQVYMPDVTSRPDRFAYFDETLVSFLKKIGKEVDVVKPIRIVTFDKDLIIRLRAVAMNYEPGVVEIIDKEDLKGFLLNPQEDFR